MNRMIEATSDQLRGAVTEMDRLAQNTLNGVAAMAQVALEAMERPEFYLELEVLAQILSSIVAKARRAEVDINEVAGGVNCSYIDEAMLRRQEANINADEITTAGSAA